MDEADKFNKYAQRCPYCGNIAQGWHPYRSCGCHYYLLDETREEYLRDEAEREAKTLEPQPCWPL